MVWMRCGAMGAGVTGDGRSAAGAGYALRVALFYAALFIVYGIQLPFLPLWLQSRGLTPEAISLATALPLFVRLVATPSIAVAADRGDRHAAIAIVLAAVGLIAALMLPLAAGPVAITALVLVFVVVMQSTMPLVETIAMRGVRTTQLDYGRMRLWGSVTFMAANVLGGIMIETGGSGSIAAMLLAGAALTLAGTLILPRPPAEVTAKPADQPSSDGMLAPLLRLLRRRDFVLLLVATGAIQASHAVFYALGAVHWRAQGLSSLWIGVLWALGVVVEILLFAYSARAIRAVGALGLLIIGGVSGIVRWTATAFDPPLAVLIPLQVFHAGTFGATHLAAMHLIANMTTEAEAGAAQSLHATVASGIAMGIAMAIVGPLYARVGGLSYLAMALLAAVGLAAALVLARTLRSRSRA
jgi:MFS transporter, PPP family, 3-phenylpropionic acid transporter